jgi:GTP-binding protein
MGVIVGLPRVLIVGRPNVGKSTLFNRLLGSRAAVVQEKPKVTRDVKEGAIQWGKTEFLVADSGGWLASGDDLDLKVSAMVERFLERSELVAMMVDAAVGVTEEDMRVAKMLKHAGVKVVLVANKCESVARENSAWEFLKLGFGDPVMVSSLHGTGIGDLLDRIESELSDISEVRAAETIEQNDEVKVAIVGRPNVGKSTLFNRLVGDDRSVVYDLPGTTVDTIDTVVKAFDHTYRFFDTAGLRRSSRYGEATEYYSMVRTLSAIDRADIALLVVDSVVGITGWDLRLAERIDASGSPIVVIMNKWEILDAERRLALNAELKTRFDFLYGATILRVSALTGRGLARVFPAINAAIDQYHTRIPTATLNKVLQEIQSKHPSKEGRIVYGVQGASDPPTFTLFATRKLSPVYLRFIENQLRQRFGLGLTPLKIRVRRRS